MRTWIAGLPVSLLALPLAAAALASDLEVINPKSAFPDGPYVQADILFYAQYGDDSVMIYDDGDQFVFWKQEGCGPTAVESYGEGLLVTCRDAKSLVNISTEGQTMATIDKDSNGDGLLGPNDLTSDGKGGHYITASGPWRDAPVVGKVYHLAKDGTLLPLTDDMNYPSGIALSPDGKLLYVVESEAGQVVTFAVAADGSLSDRQSFVVIRIVDPASGVDNRPDGLKFGPDGNLYIGQLSLGRIVAVTPKGEFVQAIDVPAPAAPNFTFNEHGTLLYIMAVDEVNNPPYGGTVYSLKWSP